MESILGALRVQVTTSKDELYMEGSIPAIVPEESDLVTIARTSALRRECNPPSQLV